VKRPLSFLLLLVYLLSSPGLGYSMHYCGQKLTGFSVLAETPKSCCPPRSAPCGGCHDKHVSSPVQDAPLLTTAALALSVPALLPEPLAYSWPAASRPQPGDPERQRPRAAVRTAVPPPWPAYVRGHAFRL
jgi:hypothetical protein